MLSDFGPAPPVTWPSKIGRKGLHFDEVGISWHSMLVLNKAELAYLSNSCLYFSSSDILFFFLINEFVHPPAPLFSFLYQIGIAYRWVLPSRERQRDQRRLERRYTKSAQSTSIYINDFCMLFYNTSGSTIVRLR